MFAWLKNWWKSLWEEKCECTETDCPSADECCELDECCAAEPDEVHAVPTFHEFDIIELHLDDIPVAPEPPELVEYSLPVVVCPEPEPPAKPKKARAPRKTAVKKAPKKVAKKTPAKKKK